MRMMALRLRGAKIEGVSTESSSVTVETFKAFLLVSVCLLFCFLSLNLGHFILERVLISLLVFPDSYSFRSVQYTTKSMTSLLTF